MVGVTEIEGEIGSFYISLKLVKISQKDDSMVSKCNLV